MKRYYRYIGFLILLIILAKIDFQKIMVQFSEIRASSFLLINLLVLPSIFFRACRWKSLLSLQGVEYSLKDSFLAYLGGLYVGIITPGRMGEAIKAVYLKQDKEMPYNEGLASVFLDRMFDVYVLILLSVLALVHFFGLNNLYWVMLTLAMVVFLLTIPLFLANKPIMEKLGRAVYNAFISRLDSNVFQGSFKGFFAASKKIVMRNISLPAVFTLLAFGVYAWQCYLLAHLSNLRISFMAVISFVSISSLIAIVPVTIFGIGTREATMIYLFSLIGFEAEKALAYSFLLFFSLYVPTAVLGGIGWFLKGKRS